MPPKLANLKPREVVRQAGLTNSEFFDLLAQ
jgi:hypothetical protein